MHNHDSLSSPSRRFFLRSAAAAAALFARSGHAQGSGTTYVYVGCYTARGPGVSIYSMDPATGLLTYVDVARGLVNPSFVAMDPMQRYLYAVNETGTYQGRPTGYVTAFARDAATGQLTQLNVQPSEGQAPAHISVDPTGRVAMLANYTTGTVTSFLLEGDGKLSAPVSVIQHTGQLGPNTGRQNAPHAHYIQADAAGRFVLANDLSLDKTFVYRLDRTSGALTPHSVPFAAAQPGAGPRHLAFHPSGKWVFVINELDNTINAFAYDAEAGTLTKATTTPTLPKDWIGLSTTAQIVISPDGRFVYGSNRGNNTIVCFEINPGTGELYLAGHTPTRGETPRNFNIDPAGNFLYVGHQNTDNIVVFKIDRKTGGLTQTGQMIQTGQPVCLVFAPPASAGNSVQAGVTFWATRMHQLNREGYGQTTLAWNAPAAGEVEIHVGSPNGPNVGRHPAWGTLTTGEWVTDGMTFYLQDVTGGKPLDPQYTLGTVRAVAFS